MTEADPSEKAVEKAAWSFDLGAFGKHLPHDNDLESTIRGHLYLEHVLIHLLREALPNFHLMQIERVPFSIKVEICAALGVLSPDLVFPIKKINELRNKVAHKIDYTISVQDKRDLLNLFPEVGRELVLEFGKPGQSFPVERVSVAQFVRVAVVMADISRQSYVAWKMRRDAALENANKVLEETEPGGRRGSTDMHAREKSRDLSRDADETP